MHVTIITAFPEFFGDFLSTSIVGRAVKKGLVQVDLVDLRAFGRGGYRQIDDYAFGAGGMVLAAPQLLDALNAARGGKDAFVVYPSPQGPLLTQEIVETLFHQEHVVILCGHYEGVDERFVRQEVDLEVSVGDCVLTGGEIPAMAMVDALSRLVPGVVGRGEAVVEDSFYHGMLDHPHYTRPALWEGMPVPEVLLGGNEAEVLAWRRSEAAERTLSRRPDLLARAAIRDYIAGNVYLAFLSREAPTGEAVAALSALCGFYGLGRPLLLITDAEARRAFSQEGLEPAPRVFGGMRRALDWIQRRDEREPLTVAVLSGPGEGWTHTLEVKRRCLKHEGPVLFLFPEGEGSPEGAVLTSLSQERESLPLAARVAVALDRFLGRR